MAKSMTTLSDAAESVPATTAPVAVAPDGLRSNPCSTTLSGVTGIDHKTLVIDLPAEHKKGFAEASSSADDVVNVVVTTYFLAVRPSMN